MTTLQSLTLENQRLRARLAEMEPTNPPVRIHGADCEIVGIDRIMEPVYRYNGLGGVINSIPVFKVVESNP